MRPLIWKQLLWTVAYPSPSFQSPPSRLHLNFDKSRTCPEPSIETVSPQGHIVTSLYRSRPTLAIQHQRRPQHCRYPPNISNNTVIAQPVLPAASSRTPPLNPHTNIRQPSSPSRPAPSPPDQGQKNTQALQPPYLAIAKRARTDLESLLNGNQPASTRQHLSAQRPT
ncbi:hypothetical protein B0T25DRAFT_280603 [Lasiosphaeria hispida]|uniref:Uncharacterized protein n=1 Tax=Lasiosphaeria hispida TaxID=260671 RepID=A0AAJ0HBM9_9PEZI|nr:hypothetical protein B0T25DRAFT_280603 [Lasiosphaeria hispida]